VTLPQSSAGRTRENGAWMLRVEEVLIVLWIVVVEGRVDLAAFGWTKAAGLPRETRKPTQACSGTWLIVRIAWACRVRTTTRISGGAICPFFFLLTWRAVSRTGYLLSM
jgi:hypothetical protein